MLGGCQQDNRAQQLDAREAALAKREQALSSKEDDYQSLLKLRDSLSLAHHANVLDSTASPQKLWTDSLLGEWDSRLLCTSTTCKGYVIGDQRTEQWRFLKDSIGFYLDVRGKGNSVKRYRAQVNDDIHELALSAESDGQSAAQTLLTFTHITGNTFRGQQRSTGADNCKLVFSVQLTPKQ